jgi:hypothetical protein
MGKKIYVFGITIFVLISASWIVGCSEGPGVPGGMPSTGKTTGGGTIPSASGNEGEIANFGFNAALCDLANPVEGKFNYHDKYAAYPGGVKFNGDIVGFVICDDDPLTNDCHVCPEDSVEAEIAYRSTNPKNKGEGTAFACVVDNGEGVNEDPEDMGEVEVIDGPYAGYLNGGPVQGNIQAHICTCTDGIDNDGDLLIDAADPSCTDPNADEE